MKIEDLLDIERIIYFQLCSNSQEYSKDVGRDAVRMAVLNSELRVRILEEMIE